MKILHEKDDENLLFRPLTSGANLKEAASKILQSEFTADDYKAFDQKLKEETELAVIEWRDKFLLMEPPTMGCEIESSLTDHSGNPLPESTQFLDYFSMENGLLEISRYNVEFEIAPIALKSRALAAMYEALDNNHRHTTRCADLMDSRLMLCGILPSLTRDSFSADMITDRRHFRVLGSQLRKLNGNRPFSLNIGYGDGLHFDADNLSIEGAATSLQVHLGISESESAAYYNAAQIASALTVGVGANSPFFMGNRLWAETRVPIFEQIMYERFAGSGLRASETGRRRSDIFGNDYLHQSLLELFMDNYRSLPAVLPIVRDTPTENLTHLILHNRDILRWNRPIIGFINQHPFLRIEHRVLPAGPTVLDMTANMAFFIGLICHYKQAFSGTVQNTTMERMPFNTVRENFYSAARDGLSADINWMGKRRKLSELALNESVVHARRGLESMGLDAQDINVCLDVIAKRIASGQNGSVWQQRFVAQHGGGAEGMLELVRAYWDNQEQGAPVHSWTT